MMHVLYVIGVALCFGAMLGVMCVGFLLALAGLAWALRKVERWGFRE